MHTVTIIRIDKKLVVVHSRMIISILISINLTF